MNGFGRGENRSPEKKGILTRETVGMTVLLFSVLALLILVTGPLLFGEVGAAITAFFVGLGGYFVYPVLLIAAIASLSLVAGRKLVPTRWLVRPMLLVAAVFFIVHTATDGRFFYEEGTRFAAGYGSYLAGCWGAAAESAAAGTGGGVLFGLVAYPVRLLLSEAGAYVLYAVLTLAALVYLLFLTPFKNAVRKQKDVPARQEGEIPFGDLPAREAPQGTYQGQTVYPDAPPAYGAPEPYGARSAAPMPEIRPQPVPRTAPAPQPVPAPVAESEGQRRSRDILFGGTAAESYRNNLIFDKTSAFNTRPRASSLRPDGTSVPDAGEGDRPYAPVVPSSYTPAPGYTPYTPPAQGSPFAPFGAPYTPPAQTPPAEERGGYASSYSEGAEEARPAMPRKTRSVGRDYEGDAALRYPEPQYHAPLSGETRADSYANDVAPQPFADDPAVPRSAPTPPPAPARDTGRGFGRDRGLESRDPGREGRDISRDGRDLGRDRGLEGRDPGREGRDISRDGRDLGRDAETGDEDVFGGNSGRGILFGGPRDVFDDDGSASSIFDDDEPLSAHATDDPAPLEFYPEAPAPAAPPAPAPAPMPAPAPAPMPAEEAPAPAPKKKKRHIWKKYRRPSLDILAEYEDRPQLSNEEIGRNSGIILDTLRRYRIETRVKKVVGGAAVTRYDLEMPEGATINMVTKYSGELAVFLNVDGVNMYANPEVGGISVEVPNDHRATVGLKNMLSSKSFLDTPPDALTVAIGQDIEGRWVCGDITKMTHVLVAGQTNSGKSITIHAMIASMIYKYSPEDLRLILIDPKQTEFVIYEGLPHLMINEIVVDPPKAISALRWAVKEMERRYSLFNEKTRAGMSVRKIDEYNAVRTEEEDKLPKLVIIVDEFSDLMLTAKKELEELIRRLTQKARAAGIHIILATQRPSAEVVTGIIKSNLPTRVALRVDSDLNSRIILDEGGAEKLLGNGDMIYKEGGKARRLQGAFISTRETQDFVNFIRENNECFFDDEALDFIDKSGGGDAAEGSFAGAAEGEGGADGPVTEQHLRALAMVVRRGQASISLIQRSCGVGYNHAGKIIEWMEAKGYISPFDGKAKARSVLLTKEEYEQLYGPLD